MNAARVCQLADQLGDVKRRIAELQVEENRLKSLLKSSDYYAMEGDHYRVVVAHPNVRRVDYKSIVKALRKTARVKMLIKAHTTVSQETRVYVTELDS